MVSPAAIQALLDGDFENYMIASTPGGIEAQEIRGQAELACSDQLPIECRNASREQLEALGFVFGEIIDELFIEAWLPKGWYKEITPHSMYTNLLDSRGRVRGHIFYKAAFYDRRAGYSLVCRYSYDVEPTCGWEDDKYIEYPRWGVVKDGEEVIWHTEPTSVPQPAWLDDRTTQWFREVYKLEAKAEDWIDEHYPDYNNPFAYWDEE